MKSYYFFGKIVDYTTCTDRAFCLSSFYLEARRDETIIKRR